MVRDGRHLVGIRRRRMVAGRVDSIDRVGVGATRHDTGVVVRRRPAAHRREDGAISIDGVAGDADVVRRRRPAEVDCKRAVDGPVQVCRRRRCSDVGRRRDDLVVERKVEVLPARRIADVNAPDRRRAERLRRLVDDLASIEPHLDLAGCAVEEHVHFELVPAPRADRRPHRAHARRLVVVGELAVAAAPDARDRTRRRGLEPHQRGVVRVLADHLKATVVVQLRQGRAERLVRVCGRPRARHARRPGAGIDDLLLHRRPARARPLRKISALETVAEDEARCAGRARCEAHEDRGSAAHTTSARKTVRLRHLTHGRRVRASRRAPPQWAPWRVS